MSSNLYIEENESLRFMNEEIDKLEEAENKEETNDFVPENLGGEKSGLQGTNENRGESFNLSMFTSFAPNKINEIVKGSQSGGNKNISNQNIINNNTQDPKKDVKNTNDFSSTVPNKLGFSFGVQSNQILVNNLSNLSKGREAEGGSQVSGYFGGGSLTKKESKEANQKDGESNNYQFYNEFIGNVCESKVIPLEGNIEINEFQQNVGGTPNMEYGNEINSNCFNNVQYNKQDANVNVKDNNYYYNNDLHYNYPIYDKRSLNYNHSNFNNNSNIGSINDANNPNSNNNNAYALPILKSDYNNPQFQRDNKTNAPNSLNKQNNQNNQNDIEQPSLKTLNRQQNNQNFPDKNIDLPLQFNPKIINNDKKTTKVYNNLSQNDSSNNNGDIENTYKTGDNLDGNSDKNNNLTLNYNVSVGKNNGEFIGNLKSQLEKCNQMQKEYEDTIKKLKDSQKEHAKNLEQLSNEFKIRESKARSTLSKFDASLQEQQAAIENSYNPQIAALKSQLKDKNSEIRRTEKDIEELKNRQSSTQNSVLYKKNQEIFSQISQKEKEIENLRGELEALRQKNSKNSENLTKNKGESDVILGVKEGSLKELEEINRILQEQVGGLRQENKELREEIKSVSGANSGNYGLDCGNLEAEVQNLIRETRNLNEIAANSIGNLAERYDNLMNVNSGLYENPQVMYSNNVEIGKQVNQLREIIKQLNSKTVELTRILSLKINTNETLQQEVDRLSVELNALKSQCSQNIAAQSSGNMSQIIQGYNAQFSQMRDEYESGLNQQRLEKERLEQYYKEQLRQVLNKNEELRYLLSNK